MFVDDIEKPDLAALDGHVDLNVQRPQVIQTFGTHPLVASRPAAALLAHASRTFEPRLDPQSGLLEFQQLISDERPGQTAYNLLFEVSVV